MVALAGFRSCETGPGLQVDSSIAFTSVR